MVLVACDVWGTFVSFIPIYQTMDIAYTTTHSLTDLGFRDDAPGVDKGLTDDSISFWKSFLFDLTSSSVIFWVGLDPKY